MLNQIGTYKLFLRTRSAASPKIPKVFSRHLFYSADLSNRRTFIHGTLGDGKTKLLLQLVEYLDDIRPDEALFIFADNLWLRTESLNDKFSSSLGVVKSQYPEE